jgi:CRP/FNR family transcriptional regulator, cyclic AMP receptor protein
MIKSDGPGHSGWSPLNESDRSIGKRLGPGAPAPNSTFGNSKFGNSSFGNSGFSDSGFGNSAFGPSGIVPTNAPGMPPGIVGLLQAIHSATSVDTMRLTLGVAQWQVLATYLQPFTMEVGQALIEQGSKDTTVYLIEAGTFSVHLTDDTGHVQLAMVGPGSCVGEGAFFSRNPRNATVQATSRCKLWSINPMRFTELSNRHPAVALALVMALGSVVARRVNNRPKRGAVT